MTVGESVLENWGEFLALSLLVIGLLLSLSISSAILLYIVVILSGFLAGRYYYTKIGRQPLFPFFLIIIGFMLGYALGSVVGNRIVVVILFIASWITSHQVHKNGYIRV
ncbi:MAG: hypothetical protein V3V78_01515 [Candidatus Woesearchaeota archaeon]